MKKPLIVVIAIILGVVATNALLVKKSDNVAADVMVEDTIETSQAADIPL